MMTSVVILFAIVGVRKLQEWGFNPLREITSFVRRPWFERLLLLFFICGMVHYGATKGTNGTDNATPPSPGLMMTAAPVVSPVAVDSIGFSLPTNFPPVTNLCFWGIERDAASVSLGIAWPGAIHPVNNCIDLFGSWRLATNGWSRVAQVDIGGAQSNAVVHVDFADLPTNAMESTAFYLLADQSDTDGDGLSDVFERLVSGTSPSNIDSDGDGIGDGDEVALGTNPLSVDTDGDGISDAEEAGSVEMMPDDETFWLYTGSPLSIWLPYNYIDSAQTCVTLPYSYTVNGVTYAQIKLCVDGLLYLLNPQRPNGVVMGMLTEQLSLCDSPLSESHVAIAHFGADLVKTLDLCSSVTCGYNYRPRLGCCSIIELLRFGFANEQSLGFNHSFDCQVVFPRDRPNVFFLNYHARTYSRFLVEQNPTIGVQCPMLPPRHADERSYGLVWRPSVDSFSADRTVKFTIGLGTNPRSSDTDGDGIDDGDELAMGTNPLACDDAVTDLEQELPDGANTNAYYWVDVASVKYTHVTFSGDGESDLPDPNFMLAAGDPCRVKLLIGKAYSVSSRHPISVVGCSSDDIEIEGNGTTSLTISWPVEMYVVEGNGAGFMMDVIPNNLNGVFSWVDTCCPVTGYYDHFWFACDRNCACGGCCAEGYYCYEGYEKACEGGWCDCAEEPVDDPYAPEVDDGPYAAGVSVSFSKSVVIFEDAYTNMPGEVVSRRSTQTTLTCIAHGGERGGTAEFKLTGANRLLSVSGGTLPVTRFVPPGQRLSLEIVYEGVMASGGEEDIFASAEFTESETGRIISANDAFQTVVKVELEAVYEAPENKNPSRHVYGVGEQVKFRAFPALTGVRFSTRKLDVGDDGSDAFYELFDGQESVDASNEHTYTCPISANYHPPVVAEFAGVEYHPLMSILEPQEIVTRGVAMGANILDLFYSGNRWCWPYGIVGSACLVTTNYIGPMTVSFQGIAVSEVPCDVEDVITGCFTNGHYRTHTRQAGAGNAYYVRSNNFWFVDGARSESSEQNWIPDSRLNWKIPVGWHRKIPGVDNYHGVYAVDFEIAYDERSRPLLIGGGIDVYKQCRHIDLTGTYRTDKFGHWISRSRWCRVILDGVVIQSEHVDR